MMNNQQIDYSADQVSEAELKNRLRYQISQQAGDTASLLGTTADATQLLLHAVATLVSRLNTAKSLADVRAAAAPFNDLAISFLAKVESGEVKLPFKDKGLDKVVADIEQRATAVAEVLASANNGGN